MNRRTALLASTWGFFWLYVGSIVALGTPPGIDADGVELVAWFQQHHDAVRWSNWLALLSVPLFASHALLVRDWMGRTAGRFYLLGATAVLILTTLSTWVLLGLARRPETLDPGVARTMLDVAAFWGPTLTGFTVLTLGAVVFVSLREQRLPRWVGILAAVAFVEQAIESVTIFGTSGFLGAGGPMNTVLGAGLCVLTWLVVGILASRRPSAAQMDDALPASTLA